MMVIPLVVSSVFAAVTSFDDLGRTGHPGGAARGPPGLVGDRTLRLRVVGWLRSLVER